MTYVPKMWNTYVLTIPYSEVTIGGIYRVEEPQSESTPIGYYAFRIFDGLRRFNGVNGNSQIQTKATEDRRQVCLKSHNLFSGLLVSANAEQVGLAHQTSYSFVYLGKKQKTKKFNLWLVVF